MVDFCEANQGKRLSRVALRGRFVTLGWLLGFLLGKPLFPGGDNAFQESNDGFVELAGVCGHF